MNYNIISTGSKGNCIIVNEFLCLDMGITYKKIQDYLDKIKVIFISHKHSDHFKEPTIKKIAYNNPNIKFIVGFAVAKKLVDIGIDKRKIYVLDIEKWYQIGDMKVRLDYLLHDVSNNAIHIEFKNGFKLLYATDTKNMNNIEAKNYDLYLIEANYDTDEELDEKIKKAEEEGKYTHYKRVKETHMSQLDAINWLDKNKGDKSVYHFIHQHREEKEDENIK